MLNALPEDRLRIHIDTRRPVQGETIVNLLSTIIDTLRQKVEGGSGARIEILEVGQGSWWAEILIISGTVIAGIGAVATAAENLAKEIREGRTPFSIAVAETVAEGDATRCEIHFHAAIIEIASSEIGGLQGMAVGENARGLGPRGTPTLDELKWRQVGHGRLSEGETGRFLGRVSDEKDGPTFTRDDGARALIDMVDDDVNLPHEQPIEIVATLGRGSRGGIADPRLHVHSWQPADDPPPVLRARLAGRFGKIIGGGFQFEDEDSGKLYRVGRGEYRDRFPIGDLVVVFGSRRPDEPDWIEVNEVIQLDPGD